MKRDPDDDPVFLASAFTLAGIVLLVACAMFC